MNTMFGREPHNTEGDKGCRMLSVVQRCKASLTFRASRLNRPWRSQDRQAAVEKALFNTMKRFAIKGRMTKLPKSLSMTLPPVKSPLDGMKESLLLCDLPYRGKSQEGILTATT